MLKCHLLRQATPHDKLCYCSARQLRDGKKRCDPQVTQSKFIRKINYLLGCLACQGHAIKSGFPLFPCRNFHPCYCFFFLVGSHAQSCFPLKRLLTVVHFPSSHIIAKIFISSYRMLSLQLHSSRLGPPAILPSPAGSRIVRSSFPIRKYILLSGSPEKRQEAAR